MPQRKWCCHSHDRSQSPDSPNVRHPILSKRALRNKPSSLDTPSYDDSDIQLSFLVPGRLSDDSGILPDPRDLTSDASPTTTTNPGSLTPTAMAMKLRQRMSRDSTTFNVIRQQRKLQKKSRRILKSKESTIDLDDLVGLHLATRTPSRGGYDADARLFTESALLASVEENQVSLERRNARVVTPPPRQQRSIAHLPRGIGRRSPLFEVQRISSSEESSDDTAPRTSTSTHPSDTPRTPQTEDVTGTVVTATISSLENTKDVSLGPFDDTREMLQGSAELQPPFTLNRLSLGQFSQSSLHLKNALMRIDDTSLTEVPELLANNSVELDCNEDPIKSRNPQAYARLERSLRTSAPHLQDMRISQHLRSLSSFSEDQAIAETPLVETIREPYNIEGLQSKSYHQVSSGVSKDKTTPSWEAAAHDKLEIIERPGGCSTKDVPELPGDVGVGNRKPFSGEEIDEHHDVYQEQGQRDSAVYDGPADQLLVPPTTNRARSRGSSITENIEETAAVWEKAFAGYQMEQLERGRKKRSGSASHTGRQRASSTLSRPEQDQRFLTHSLSSTIESVAKSGDSESYNAAFRPGKLLDDAAVRDNAVSYDVKRTRSVGPMDEELDVPSITLTKPERFSEVLIEPTTPPRKRFQAWARFSSEGREERNASAGIADNVIARDFAPPSPSTSVLTGSEPGASAKRKSKSSALKHKLAGLPDVFKGKNFRTRNTGHRTSIAPGGELEYPELELLPGAETHEISVMEAWTGAMSSEGNVRRDFSFDSHRSGEDLGNRTVSSVGGSSRYESVPGSPPTSITSNRRGRPTAAEMAEYYVQYVGPAHDPEYVRRRATELISPLDGSSASASAPSTIKVPRKSRSLLSLRKNLGSKSMPATLQVKFASSSSHKDERPSRCERQMLGRITSTTEGLRRSTQDLNTLLEKSAKSEAEKAIRAAERW